MCVMSDGMAGVCVMSDGMGTVLPICCLCVFFCFFNVRSSVQLKIHAANIEASKFVCFLSLIKVD